MLGVALLGVSIAGVPAGFPASPGTKLPVQKLEFGYRIDSGGIKGRVTLATGEAIDFNIEDKESFLRIAQVFAAGRTRLEAEVQDGRVLALDVTIQ